MIPSIDILTEEITEVNYPNRTYRIAFSADNDPMTNRLRVVSLSTTVESDNDRINGYVDDLEAVMQAIYLILSTERYEFIIYSWDYGIELIDLIGKPPHYVMSELPRRITDALIQDNRITNVTDFQFTQSGKKLHTTFTVVSNIGNIATELEVAV